MLARNGLEVLVVAFRKRTAERRIKVLAHRPALARGLAAAEFERGGALVLHQRDGRIVEGVARFVVGSKRAAFHAEGRGDHRVAEQQALLMHQRQHACDGAIAFRQQKMRIEAKDIAENRGPARAVKKSAARG